MNFVSTITIVNKRAVVQVMAWRLLGAMALPEPMSIKFSDAVPEWVNLPSLYSLRPKYAYTAVNLVIIDSSNGFGAEQEPSHFLNQCQLCAN